jgi:N-acetylglucosaminyldiphosphoundecaprenol N-acetyl-beta-D-mannosaminyltransferase
VTEQHRLNVLGVLISPVDRKSATDRVVRAAQAHEPLGVSALAVHGLMTSVMDPELKTRVNDGLDLVVPDGQPIRWALNWVHGAGLRERVYGPHLMLDVVARASKEGLAIYLFGSTESTLQKLTQNLTRQFPGLKVAGSQPSRFRSATEEERQADVRRILDCGADIVFVGLGCPRQEIWVQENSRDLSRPALAVGAAFDYHAGTLPKPPPWMQRAGLEWLFRLRQEPGRLWKRYLYLNPAYLTLLACQLTRLRRFPVSAADQAPPLRRPG